MLFAKGLFKILEGGGEGVAKNFRYEISAKKSPNANFCIFCQTILHLEKLPYFH